MEVLDNYKKVYMIFEINAAKRLYILCHKFARNKAVTISLHFGFIFCPALFALHQIKTTQENGRSQQLNNFLGGKREHVALAQCLQDILCFKPN